METPAEVDRTEAKHEEREELSPPPPTPHLVLRDGTNVLPVLESTKSGQLRAYHGE